MMASMEADSRRLEARPSSVPTAAYLKGGEAAGRGGKCRLGGGGAPLLSASGGIPNGRVWGQVIHNGRVWGQVIPNGRVWGQAKNMATSQSQAYPYHVCPKPSFPIPCATCP